MQFMQEHEIVENLPALAKSGFLENLRNCEENDNFKMRFHVMLYDLDDAIRTFLYLFTKYGRYINLGEHIYRFKLKNKGWVKGRRNGVFDVNRFDEIEDMEIDLSLVTNATYQRFIEHCLNKQIGDPSKFKANFVRDLVFALYDFRHALKNLAPSKYAEMFISTGHHIYMVDESIDILLEDDVEVAECRLMLELGNEKGSQKFFKLIDNA